MKRSTSSIVWNALAATSLLMGVQAAAIGQPADRTGAIVMAQATAAPSAQGIRERAQRIKEYRDLLADRDANVRFAALDEMLKSDDAVLRELAYDAGFASAEPAMRAIVLRSRILGMNNFTLELQRPDKMTDEQWQKITDHFGGTKLSLALAKPDVQTGNLQVGYDGKGHVSGQEFTFSVNGSAGTGRLRLQDGAEMRGGLNLRGISATAVFIVQ